MSDLTRYEQETIIRYNQDEKTATVFTHHPALIAVLHKNGQKGEPMGEALQFVVPKTWVKVRPPRRVEMTDEQRAERAARMRGGLKKS